MAQRKDAKEILDEINRTLGNHTISRTMVYDWKGSEKADSTVKIRKERKTENECIDTACPKSNGRTSIQFFS
jgi:hypothetical protein